MLPKNKANLALQTLLTADQVANICQIAALETTGKRSCATAETHLKSSQTVNQCVSANGIKSNEKPYNHSEQ
jgi:hypothetical protein